MQTTRRFFIQGISLTAIASLFGVNAVIAAPINEPPHGREPQRKSPDRRPPETPKRQVKPKPQEPRRENRDRKPGNNGGRFENRQPPR